MRSTGGKEHLQAESRGTDDDTTTSPDIVWRVAARRASCGGHRRRGRLSRATTVLLVVLLLFEPCTAAGSRPLSKQHASRAGFPALRRLLQQAAPPPMAAMPVIPSSGSPTVSAGASAGLLGPAAIVEEFGANCPANPGNHVARVRIPS